METTVFFLPNPVPVIYRQRSRKAPPFPERTVGHAARTVKPRGYLFRFCRRAPATVSFPNNPAGGQNPDNYSPGITGITGCRPPHEPHTHTR
jgi:hypothetical protein